MSEEAFIYEAIRTPRGKGKNGALTEVKPLNLITGLIDELRGLGGGGANGAQVAAPAPQPQLPAGTAPLPPVPEEITVLARFVEAVRREKLDDKLFGKDDAAGNIVEPGIFTYDQVKILADVRTGKEPVERLDALLTDSGQPEAITAKQMAEAVTVLFTYPKIVQDISRFMELRDQARKKKP